MLRSFGVKLGRVYEGDEPFLSEYCGEEKNVGD